MQILTAKEFENKAAPIKKEQPVFKKSENKIESKIKWKLFYTDNPLDKYHSGKYLVEFNNDKIELKIEDGIVETDDKIVKEILIRQGFILIQEVKK